MALLLACAVYEDATIPRLRSPERDAEELAAVLSDETRGRYEVQTVVNSTVDEARVAIEEFLGEGRRDDLLLLYFSCHGILDARNELHLAFRNTRQNLLQSTGLSRAWIHGQLNEARPQSSVVLVDCCFSGAFVHAGLRSLAARRPVDVEGLVRDPPAGKARAVLTASTATQLSFEDDVSRAEAAARPSYFTEAVITALRSGAADRDRDGRITVDDLYSFVYDRVTRAGHGQEPQRAIYGAGDLVIAYAGRHEPEPPPPPEPPGSDLTLLIKPDMVLAPWPPLAGDAAARRRPQDHRALHADAYPSAWRPQPHAAPSIPPRRPPSPIQRDTGGRRPRLPPQPVTRRYPAAPPVSPPGLPAAPAVARHRSAVPRLVLGLLLGLLVIAAAGLIAADADVLARLRDRLENGGSSDISMTVTRVRSGGGKTQADITIINRSGETLSLPVFGNCTLLEQENGRSHAADPFATDKSFNSSILAETTSRGTLVFEGTLSAGTTRVTIGFDNVFGNGKPLIVRDVAVR